MFRFSLVRFNDRNSSHETNDNRTSRRVRTLEHVRNSANRRRFCRGSRLGNEPFHHDHDHHGKRKHGGEQRQKSFGQLAGTERITERVDSNADWRWFGTQQIS